MANKPTINVIVRNALCARRSAFVRFLIRLKTLIGVKYDCIFVDVFLVDNNEFLRSSLKK